MENWLITNEAPLRLACFISALLVLAIAQWLAPKRDNLQAPALHRTTNMLMALAGMLTLRVLMPMLAVGLALLAQANGWGLFNQQAVQGLLPWWVMLPLAMVLLDLAIYWQHRITHMVPFLWRLHAVHHTDQALDVTSGVRFHPLEILLSMLFKMLLVVGLGLPAVAVLLFEVVLNVASLFEHSNMRLPAGFERTLRLLLVTPDMHRVHHSVHRDEHDANYGFCLSVWDRLFGSYKDQPRDGHEQMQLGLVNYQQGAQQNIIYLLLQPFLNAPKQPELQNNDGDDTHA